MKIQTRAVLEQLRLDDKDISLRGEQKVALEFSAIDAGGGFKDPMLDFSIPVSGLEMQQHHQREVQLSISHPQNSEQGIQLSYKGEITITEEQVNGRITKEDLSKEAIAFVFKLIQ